MKRKLNGSNNGSYISGTLEVICVSDLLDTLDYLGERELSGVLEIVTKNKCDGYLTASPDIAARLFMLIAKEVPGGLLEVTASDGLLMITLSSQTDNMIPDRVALKIAKAAYLAGFATEVEEKCIRLSSKIAPSRIISVYAITRNTLLKSFKKYL